MKTSEVYERLGTPRNLQEHMLCVAGLVCELKKHWHGSRVDWDDVIKAALLHDVGNVIKFDLDKYPHLLGPEIDKIDFWKSEQKRLIDKYGPDDHEATDKMLDELSIEMTVRDTIQKKSFGNAVNILNSNDWPPKILLYCDLRVLPDGIDSLKARLDDVRERLTKYAQREDFEELVTACYQIESEIQKNVSKELNVLISQEHADSYREKLLDFQIN